MLLKLILKLHYVTWFHEEHTRNLREHIAMTTFKTVFFPTLHSHMSSKRFFFFISFRATDYKVPTKPTKPNHQPTMIEPSPSSGNSPTPCNDRLGTMAGNGSPEDSTQEDSYTDDSLAVLLARGEVLQRELHIAPPTSSNMMVLPSPQLNNPVASSLSSSFLVDIIQQALDLIGENDLDQAGGRSDYVCSGADTQKGSSLPPQ